MSNKFSATLDIIGINPFVFVPENLLLQIFKKAGKEKGHIPVKGTINGKPFTQTLVKYSSHWRLYINTVMLKDSPKKIGETVILTLDFDLVERTVPIHPKLAAAINKNKAAKKVFESLPPSRQKEIVRYISTLKAEESIDRNIARAIAFLLGKERFIGRNKP